MPQEKLLSLVEAHHSVWADESVARQEGNMFVPESAEACSNRDESNHSNYFGCPWVTGMLFVEHLFCWFSAASCGRAPARGFIRASESGLQCKG